MAVSNAMPLQEGRDYLVIENYLSDEDCQHLINYFHENVNQNSRNVNSVYNGRVIYYETLPVSEPVRALMKLIHDDCARRLTEFYQESETIYPEASHLVKWPPGTSLGDHADNAYANGDPNYVSWRSHSAVLYLNDDFEGGEFYFQKNRQVDQKEGVIHPKKGLLITFRGGLSHIHGVLQVKSGLRMTFPMWFTQNKKKAYPEYR